MVAYKLYYSHKCKFSRYFIAELEKYPDINIQFKRLCIDKNIYGQVDPLVIQDLNNYKVIAVPTIIVNNNLYTGNEAFKWLQNNQIALQPIHSSVNKQDYSPSLQYQYSSVQPSNENNNGILIGIDDSNKDSMYSLNNVKTDKRNVIGNNNSRHLESIDCNSKNTIPQDMKNRQLQSINCNVKSEKQSLDMQLQEYEQSRQLPTINHTLRQL